MCDLQDPPNGPELPQSLCLWRLWQETLPCYGVDALTSSKRRYFYQSSGPTVRRAPRRATPPIGGRRRRRSPHTGGCLPRTCPTPAALRCQDACVISSHHPRPPPSSAAPSAPPPSHHLSVAVLPTPPPRGRAAGPQLHTAAGHTTPPARPHLGRARSVATCHAGSLGCFVPLPCPSRRRTCHRQSWTLAGRVARPPLVRLLPSEGHAGRAGAVACGTGRLEAVCDGPGAPIFAWRRRFVYDSPTPHPPTSLALVRVEPRLLFGTVLREFSAPRRQFLSPFRPLLDPCSRVVAGPRPPWWRLYRSARQHKAWVRSRAAAVRSTGLTCGGRRAPLRWHGSAFARQSLSGGSHGPSPPGHRQRAASLVPFT